MPWLTLISYCIPAILGFLLAWQIQSVNIREIKVEHQTQVVEAVERGQQLTRETSDAWAKNLDALRKRYAGGWVPQLPKPTGPGIPTPAGVDAPSTDSTPVAGGVAEELGACKGERDELVKQAAETTLQLNTLQKAIEKQQGY